MGQKGRNGETTMQMVASELLNKHDQSERAFIYLGVAFGKKKKKILQINIFPANL